MQIHRVQDDTNAAVIDILKHGLVDLPDVSKVNYEYEYRENTANLFYLLKNGRYNTGMYYVITDNSELVASSGWNKYSDDTAIIMSRTYTSKKSRGEFIISELLLQEMIDSTTEFENVYITLNSYNSGIYRWVSKNPNMGKFWPKIWNSFKPIGTRTIYNTEQFVLRLERD